MHSAIKSQYWNRGTYFPTYTSNGNLYAKLRNELTSPPHLSNTALRHKLFLVYDYQSIFNWFDSLDLKNFLLSFFLSSFFIQIKISYSFQEKKKKEQKFENRCQYSISIKFLRVHRCVVFVIIFIIYFSCFSIILA